MVTGHSAVLQSWVSGLLKLGKLSPISDFCKFGYTFGHADDKIHVPNKSVELVILLLSEIALWYGARILWCSVQIWLSH